MSTVSGCLIKNLGSSQMMKEFKSVLTENKQKTNLKVFHG